MALDLSAGRAEFERIRDAMPPVGGVVRDVRHTLGGLHHWEAVVLTQPDVAFGQDRPRHAAVVPVVPRSCVDPPPLLGEAVLVQMGRCTDLVHQLRKDGRMGLVAEGLYVISRGDA